MAIGAKLFVLTLLVGLIMSVASQWEAAYRNDNASVLTIVGLTLVCAYLTTSLAEVVQGMIAGTSMGGGHAIGSMAALALAGGAMAAGGAGAADAADAAGDASEAAGGSAGCGAARAAGEPGVGNPPGFCIFLVLSGACTEISYSPNRADRTTRVAHGREPFSWLPTCERRRGLSGQSGADQITRRAPSAVRPSLWCPSICPSNDSLADVCISSVFHSSV